MLRRLAMIKITAFLLGLLLTSACASGRGNTVTVVKPRTHNSWYNKHTYKRKWHIGRLRFYPEKQGVKKVKMRG
ncbi:hypothetical protein [Chryseotalea sanaruensis]|uniref:hypothetical protein n=1 Tax=Chryseotalea sanaruensis TaxID=2482724 RepID=UPI000F8E4A71|nr:hypothetical protein [Chryseotalea sanaruensis]